MDLLIHLLDKFWVPLVTTIAAALVNGIMERRPRLITYLSQASAIELTGLAPPAGPPPAGAPAPIVPPVAAPAPQPVPLPAVAAGPVAQNHAQIPTINTHSILVRNVGKKTAFNIRISHYPSPLLGHQVAPPKSHQVISIPNGGWEILIPTLVTDESVQVTYVYPPGTFWTQINSITKSDDGPAQVVTAFPTPQPSLLFSIVRRGLLYLGIFSLAYIVLLAGEKVYCIVRVATCAIP